MIDITDEGLTWNHETQYSEELHGGQGGRTWALSLLVVISENKEAIEQSLLGQRVNAESSDISFAPWEFHLFCKWDNQFPNKKF